MSNHDELSHDPACPWRRLTVMARADCQFCPVLARARADEREQVALDTAAGIVDPGLRAVIVDDALTDLRAKWNDEGHAVMFNHAKDDLTPAERVGKWLEEVSE